MADKSAQSHGRFLVQEMGAGLFPVRGVGQDLVAGLDVLGSCQVRLFGELLSTKTDSQILGGK